MRIAQRLLLIATLPCLAAVYCDNPPMPYDIPPVPGEYKGTYTYKTGVGLSADSVVQAIIWTFTETNYLMDADTSSAQYDPQVCFCKGCGTYAITDRVRLDPAEPTAPVPDNCDTCDVSQSPQGLYMLERTESGIKLTKIEVIDEIQVTGTLLLERK